MTRTLIPNSFIAVVPKESMNMPGLDSVDTPDTKVLGEAGGSVFVQVDGEAMEGMHSLQDTGVKFVPNYQYENAIYDQPVQANTLAEEAPDTKTESGYPRHLEVIGAEAAWEISAGNPEQISAVTDTGLARNHPELEESLWKNPNEIPGNNIDDDNNGYVDDIIGWDITDNDSQPSHEGSTHHTLSLIHI